MMTPIIDFLFQIGYFSAYRIVRLYWGFRNPKTHGALVTIWCRGEILLVKNSYLKYFSLPGGYIKQGEEAIDAVVRELREEIKLNVKPDRLKLVFQTEHDWENRRDNVTIFALEVAEKPQISVDNREVISAKFYSPSEALALDLFPPIITCMEQYLAKLK